MKESIENIKKIAEDFNRDLGINHDESEVLTETPDKKTQETSQQTIIFEMQNLVNDLAQRGGLKADPTALKNRFTEQLPSFSEEISQAEYPQQSIINHLKRIEEEIMSEKA